MTQESQAEREASVAETATDGASPLRGLPAVLRFRWLGPYRATALIALAAMCVFQALRLTMLVAFADRSALTLPAVVSILTVGLRFDLLVALALVLWQAVHLTIVPEQRRTRGLSRLWLDFELLFAALLLPLLCVIEWLFFDEFQTRLNYIAFEYLVYPTEVCCNIWESYSVVPVLGLVIGGGLAGWWYSRRRLLDLQNSAASVTQRCRILAGILVLMGGLWSSTTMDCRNVTPDRVAIECAGNGLYSFVYYAVTCRFEYDRNYITVAPDEAVRRVRAQVVDPADRLLTDSFNPVDRIVSTGRPQRDWNVVLILEESLGSDFVGVLGDDRGLTPELDALSEDGLLFDNWYATGNRTARALEAVMTSMPPIPTESILKRDHSERVFTLARVLEQRGYERLFMTGGRGVFDGVRSFMTDNGFNHFIEQSDFVEPAFVNAWGVSDEDLFHRGLQELDNLQATGRPFFAMLLTVSNHRPYTYPAGRIPQTEQTRANAIRYADWALGDFFRQARTHEFYASTLFVVMGDHGARIYGSQMFPLRSYRVPVVLIEPGVEQGSRCHTLSCSLDVAPTILARLGGEYRSVFFGQDALSTTPDAGRAILQHNHDVALLDARHQLTNLGFNQSAYEYLVSPRTLELTRTGLADTDPVQNTAALFQEAYRLYYAEQWMPDTQQPVAVPNGPPVPPQSVAAR